MRPALLVIVCLALSGCFEDMSTQPKYHQYEPAELFPNGRVLQSPVEGTVARGDLAREMSVRTQPALTRALIDNGERQYAVFCSPCHGLTGDGRGMVVRRGMPSPPSYHSERLREASDQHIFNVITEGFGAMYSYAARVPPQDRWAIVAYIRALQLSQHAGLSEVPPMERERLLASP